MKAISARVTLAMGCAAAILLAGCAPAKTPDKTASGTEEVTITQTSPGSVVVTIPASLSRAGWYPQLATESCGLVGSGENTSWTTNGVSITAFAATSATSIRLHHDTQKSDTCEALPIPAKGVGRYEVARKALT